MNRSKLCVGVMAAVSAMTLAAERPAEACGGCFQPPGQTLTDITDERMLLAVSGTQSTLYDQIQYSGTPANFAWVLPIHGVVTVGLSADVLFDSIDALTATQINPPPQNCPAPTDCSANSSSGGGSFAAGTSGNAAVPAVSVLAQANVGPYATVQLKSTDSGALANWLASNGYNIPAAVQPVLDAYVQAGFDFLAMKLLPNQGVQSMRPVRVSTPGASVTLPLRMASIGTGAVTGITIWIVADGRYEPQNFPFFHIDDSQLVWDWSANISNYTTLRVAQEAKSNNGIWEIESSIDLNETIITNTIVGGGQYYPSGGPVTPSDPSVDYLPSGDPDAGTDGGYETADEVRDTDVSALFTGMAGPSVRVTRIRSDIAQTAMTNDIVFQASSDQSELSNVRNLTQAVNLSCPIYNGCDVVGTGTPAQAAASIAAGATDSGSGSSSGDSDTSSGSGSGSDGDGALAPKDSGGGCATSAGNAGSSVSFAAILGVLGLFFQRRRKPSKG